MHAIWWQISTHSNTWNKFKLIYFPPSSERYIKVCVLSCCLKEQEPWVQIKPLIKLAEGCNLPDVAAFSEKRVDFS